MTEVPRVEQLSLRERLANISIDLLRALGRNTMAFTGTPDTKEYVQNGLLEAERLANRPQN